MTDNEVGMTFLKIFADRLFTVIYKNLFA